MPQDDSVRELVTTQQAADALDYTIQHTRLLIRKGQLEGTKLGRDWVISRASFDKFLRDRNAAPSRAGTRV
jgi:excisionase family DNA binding protein